MSCCEVSVYSLAAEELFPLFQLEGFLSMAVPKPVCILCFSITKFCSRPHQAPGKGLRSKGSRKDWNSSPHTSLLLWISPAPIPKLQVHYCEKDAITSIWCLPPSHDPYHCNITPVWILLLIFILPYSHERSHLPSSWNNMTYYHQLSQTTISLSLLGSVFYTCLLTRTNL